MADALIRADPKSIPPDEYRRLFLEFLIKYYVDDVKSLLITPIKDTEDHTSISINMQDLIHFDPSLGHLLLHHSSLLLPIFDEALLQLQTQVIQHPLFHASSDNIYVKPKAHIRMIHLPSIFDYSKPSIGAIRSADFGNLIEVSGTVIRTGMVKMLEISKEYVCQKPRCGYRFRVFADFQQGNVLPQPRVCPGDCRGNQLREVEGSRECSDYQEIKIQDHVQRLAIGKVPRTMNVLLENDLVDQCKAGDDIIIVGQLVQRWKAVYKGAKCEVEVFLRAQSIRLCNSVERSHMANSTQETLFKQFWSRFHELKRPFLGRDIIMRRGVPHVNDNGLRRRGQSHLLLVGDPGTGKSQFLRFAAALIPRSVLTTGIGTTSAGLTCTALKDGADWILEAGALVLADRGLCCIDEFSSIREHDRTSIHEAMEQQTLSVAKAGLVCKLNSRTTLIAATNPKGSYDVTLDLTTNIAIASPLLSRFDLVLVLLDTPNKEWDKKVSTFILREAMACGTNASQTTHQSSPSSNHQEWDVELLRDYILFVQENLFPVLTAQAELALTRYYELQRKNDERSAARTTVRMLESLIRLSQAHARLMFRSEVLIEDAAVAIMCSEASLHTSAVLDMGSVLHQDFKDDPDQEIATLIQVISYKLRLNEESDPEPVQSSSKFDMPPPAPQFNLFASPPARTPPSDVQQIQDPIQAPTPNVHISNVHNENESNDTSTLPKWKRKLVALSTQITNALETPEKWPAPGSDSSTKRSRHLQWLDASPSKATHDTSNTPNVSTTETDANKNIPTQRVQINRSQIPQQNTPSDPLPSIVAPPASDMEQKPAAQVVAKSKQKATFSQFSLNTLLDEDDCW